MVETIWVVDPDTKKEQMIRLDELENDQRAHIIKPLGGFCWNANEFVLVPLTTAPFYVRDWMPKHGKTVLYAPPKTGKSYLCLQLARCIGAGDDFLGMPTQQGRVLYIQFELSPEVLQLRLCSTQLSYDNVFVGTTFSMKLDSEAGKQQLYKALNAVNPDVLILDPLYKMMQGDENDSKDMRLIVNTLDEAIEAFDISVLIVHHPGKDISRMGRGSSVLTDWVDSYIEMKRVQTSNKDTLRVKLTPKLLRHAELPPESIEAEMHGFEFGTADALPKVKDLVANYIAQHGTARPRDLFVANLGKNKSVYEALKTLVEEGLVGHEKRGVYYWMGNKNNINKT